MGRPTLYVVFLMAMTAGVARGQYSDTHSTARVVIGGSVGLFRISLQDFTDVYDGRVGLTPGGSIAVRVWDPYFLVLAARTFNQDTEVTNGDGSVGTVRWTQRWFNVGVRRVRFGPRVNSYLGFGVAFFRAEEEPLVRLLRDEDGIENPTGFFLDFGLDFRLGQRAAAFLAIEMTSANIGGFSGFEASSIGGFLFHTGLHFYPF